MHEPEDKRHLAQLDLLLAKREQKNNKRATNFAPMKVTVFIFNMGKKRE